MSNYTDGIIYRSGKSVYFACCDDKNYFLSSTDDTDLIQQLRDLGVHDSDFIALQVLDGDDVEISILSSKVDHELKLQKPHEHPLKFKRLSKDL